MNIAQIPSIFLDDPNKDSRFNNLEDASVKNCVTLHRIHPIYKVDTCWNTSIQHDMNLKMFHIKIRHGPQGTRELWQSSNSVSREPTVLNSSSLHLSNWWKISWASQQIEMDPHDMADPPGCIGQISRKKTTETCHEGWGHLQYPGPNWIQKTWSTYEHVGLPNREFRLWWCGKSLPGINQLASISVLVRPAGESVHNYQLTIQRNFWESGNH